MEPLSTQSILNPETGKEGLYFFSKDGRRVSPWHDIPLFTDKEQNFLHMIVEIPRGTNAKMEVGSGTEGAVRQYADNIKGLQRRKP